MAVLSTHETRLRLLRPIVYTLGSRSRPLWSTGRNFAYIGCLGPRGCFSFIFLLDSSPSMELINFSRERSVVWATIGSGAKDFGSVRRSLDALSSSWLAILTRIASPIIRGTFRCASPSFSTFKSQTFYFFLQVDNRLGIGGGINHHHAIHKSFSVRLSLSIMRLSLGSGLLRDNIIYHFSSTIALNHLRLWAVVEFSGWSLKQNSYKYPSLDYTYTRGRQIRYPFE